MKKIKKRVTEAFNKKIYLLGIDTDGRNVWLEAPSWNCGWYWGFGYIERYTHNRSPGNSRDIESHSHWDTGIIGQHEYYDTDKGCFRLSSDYIHHLNESPDFQATVLTDKESWELADLIKSFYTLREAAGLYNRGGSHLTTTKIQNLMKSGINCNNINTIDLPRIFERIDQLLTPKGGKI